MKVKLQVTMVVDSDKMPKEEFERVCAEFDDFHKNRTFDFPDKMAAFSMERLDVEKELVTEGFRDGDGVDTGYVYKVQE